MKNEQIMGHSHWNYYWMHKYEHQSLLTIDGSWKFLCVIRKQHSFTHLLDKSSIHHVDIRVRVTRTERILFLLDCFGFI